MAVFSTTALFPISYALVRFPQPDKWMSPMGYRYGIMTINTGKVLGERKSTLGGLNSVLSLRASASEDLNASPPLKGVPN